MALQGGSFQADISPDVVAGIPLVKAYGDDYFIVGNQRYNSNIMLHQGDIMAPWGPEAMDDSLLPRLQNLLKNNTPDIFILGTGRRMIFPTESMLATFHEANIGFEFMDSRAAARTYNIIVSEGRTVSAFLFLPTTSF